ncbi:vegetative cell wall protein gp1 [Drosophila serrata]|uniref:vegetative cell wall protein gp1 n=1 Tax=Drosophila serrata TaxID=7274 RepID=UPI000A1D18C8|nr:vegetative cell wall protein gp1 [Drosophila serrata]
MSFRRDLFVALACCCLALSFLGTQAKNLPKAAVSKRDTSDWYSYFDDWLFDSDSDEGTEKILVCSNCTVLVQPVPAGGAAPGSTTANVDPGTTAPAGTASVPPPASPPPVSPGAPNPPPAVSSTAPNAATAVPPTPQNPATAVPSTPQNPATTGSPAAPSSS